MFEQVLQIIAPHHCSECGILGQVLCDNCKYHIISETFLGCIVCSRPALRDGICSACNTAYSRAWVVSERKDAIRKIINDIKFERKKAAIETLVDMLDASIPNMPSDVVVCSIPTIRKHIRQRGYDHAELLARGFATKRGLTFQKVLKRKNNTVQLGSNKRQRIENAKKAFQPVYVRDDRTYLLIDDVFTSGATMEYATRAMQHAGAKDVWIAVVAKQPLDKQAGGLL